MQERRKRIPRFEEALPTHMQAEMSGKTQNETIHIFASLLVRFYASSMGGISLLRAKTRGDLRFTLRDTCWVSNAIRSRESWLHDPPKGVRGATDRNGCYLYKRRLGRQAHSTR